MQVCTDPLKLEDHDIHGQCYIQVPQYGSSPPFDVNARYCLRIGNLDKTDKFQLSIHLKDRADSCHVTLWQMQ